MKPELQAITPRNIEGALVQQTDTWKKINMHIISMKNVSYLCNETSTVFLSTLMMFLPHFKSHQKFANDGYSS